MKGLTTKTYLTKKLLKAIFKDEVVNEDFLIKMMEDEELEKHFNYYLPTEKLLRRLGIIPSEIKIKQFSRLAKEYRFSQHAIMEIFGCNKDVVRLVIDRYFSYVRPYYKKNDILNTCLEEGEEILGLE